MAGQLSYPTPSVQPNDADLTDLAGLNPGAGDVGKYIKVVGAGDFGLDTPSGSAGSPSVPSDDVATVLASSTNGHFERHFQAPSIIRLAALQTFGADIADAIASPPIDHVWANTARLNSAVVSSGVLTLSFKTDVGFNHDGGAFTAPELFRATDRADLLEVGHSWYWHISASAIADPDMYWLCCFQYSVGNDETYMLKFGLHGAAGNGTVYIDGFTSGSGNVDSLDAAAMATGAWFKLTYIGGGIFTLHYFKTAKTTDNRTIADTSWSSNMASFTVSGANILGKTWKHGITAALVATGGTFTAEWNRFDDRPNIAQRGIAGISARGFATTSDAIELVGGTTPGADFGSAKALPAHGVIRLALADAINRLPGDAATWTFSLTGSDSADPAEATTYQSAATLQRKVPGSDTVENTARRYWILRAKCASASGLQPGSIDMSVLRGLFAAAA